MLAEWRMYLLIEVQVLKDGKYTGKMPGKVVRGPGWNCIE